MGYRKVQFRHADPLASMPWDAFERLMAKHYASHGYRVEHSGTGARTSRRHFDGGIDLKLFRDGEYIVVQCKRASVFEVTHNVVHELTGVMHTQHATRFGRHLPPAGERLRLNDRQRGVDSLFYETPSGPKRWRIRNIASPLASAI